MKNVLVVSNYNAGRKRAIKHKKILHKFLLQRCKKFKFISINELPVVSLEEFDTVFTLGGDGTVNKIVTTLIENNCTDKVIGIIPCGTANLLAAKLGLSMNLKKTLKRIDKEEVKKIDVIKVNNKYSVLRCGLGYDSEIICKTPQSLKNKFGYFAYFIAGIIFATRLKTKSYTITTEDNTQTTEATSIIIANAANMYKNTISIANHSELDDGYADVFILKTKNPVAFFLEFLKIIFGIKKNNTFATYFKAQNLTIKNNWTMCHIDGEKNKLKNDINYAILPQLIKVYSNN